MILFPIYNPSKQPLSGRPNSSNSFMISVCLLFLCAPFFMHAKDKMVKASTKVQSAFYPPHLIELAKLNAKKYAWAKAIRDQIVTAAEPWKQMSDDKLWGLVFGPTITRSWMVWSNGHCPSSSCKKSVPMYTWEVDALKNPWKVRCPHCKKSFPTNDFKKYYDSALDERGIFDPKRGNRELLVNTMGGPKDFGVDDGEGFVVKGKRWRFIGAYLIYGQWKQAVLNGIKRLSAAYVVTGDPVYARKAGLMLDRVADLYPSFDYKKQGLVYERHQGTGYVSLWHDASEETRQLVLSYDRVFDGMKKDPTLLAFLSQKAKKHQLKNRKATFADVQRNIETRILKDAVTQQGRGHGDKKIASNKPRTEVCVAIIHTVLGWPNNRSAVLKEISKIVNESTKVDGLTGEKGLTNYSTIGPIGLSELLQGYAATDPEFLKAIIARCPRLPETFRFHIDTWCLEKYYPQSGDSGAFAKPVTQYRGVSFSRPGKDAPALLGSRGPALSPSMYSFLFQLFEATKNPAYVQTLYQGNDYKIDGLPYDLFVTNPDVFQKKVKDVISNSGAQPQIGSIDKKEWRLAILRSGKGKKARALWLDYDSDMGSHSHYDGMNLGLFAKGLDLMPDFGYPPVQFGGWRTNRVYWYRNSVSHNTVVVDGKNLNNSGGRMTLWADGKQVHAMRASGAKMITGGKQYERTVSMVDLSGDNFYVVDIFRVIGGTDHAKFMHSHFGSIVSKGLTLKPAKAYGQGSIMRNFRSDPKAKPGWSVDWTIKDRYKLLRPGTSVKLRYTDLTDDAEAYLAEAWVVAGRFNSSEQAWIPRILIRRRATKKAAVLASTFIGVIEPYEKTSAISSIRRLPLESAMGKSIASSHVALELKLVSGERDIHIFADPKMRGNIKKLNNVNGWLFQKEHEIKFNGEYLWARFNAKGTLIRLALCKAQEVRIGKVALKLKSQTDFLEIEMTTTTAKIISGKTEDLMKLTHAGKEIQPK